MLELPFHLEPELHLTPGLVIGVGVEFVRPARDVLPGGRGAMDRTDSAMQVYQQLLDRGGELPL